MSICRYGRGNSGIDPIRNSCLGCCRLFIQLAYIDCIFVSCTCCHIVNLAGFIHIHFAVQVYTIIPQYDIRISIHHSCIAFVQYNLGLSFGAIGNGFDTGQIFIQIDFIIGMSIFCYCRGNGGIGSIRNSCLGCCCLFLQLAYIDCIFVSCTCCHIVNLAGFIHIHFAVQVYTIIPQYDIRISIHHSCIAFVQYNLGLSFGAIGNGFDTGQIFIQIDFIIGMSIFCYFRRGNGGIGSIRNSCLGCCRLTSDLF